MDSVRARRKGDFKLRHQSGKNGFSLVVRLTFARFSCVFSNEQNRR